MYRINSAINSSFKFIHSWISRSGRSKSASTRAQIVPVGEHIIGWNTCSSNSSIYGFWPTSVYGFWLTSV